MTSIFSSSPKSLADPLLVGVVLAALVLLVVALRWPHLRRIGVRNIPRRRLRTALVVAGLMLATTFVAASLAIGDTVVLAVKSVAVYSLGRVDEVVITGNNQPYPVYFARRVQRMLVGDPRVAGVAPALELPNVVIADETSRQVRAGVSAIGLDDQTSGPLGAQRSASGAAPLSALGPDEVYLSATLAHLLRAQPGDTLTLYSTRWPGQRHQVRMRAAVSGGVLGDTPALLMPLPALQRIANMPASVNVTYIANTGDGQSGVQYSEAIASRVEHQLPPQLVAREVKAEGIRLSMQAEDIFGRILALFTVFALAIGLLLIFLIFSLLAAERRAELGVARAIGLRRAHVVWLLLFEGAAYDGAAALLGMLSGLGLGVLLVALVSPVLQRIGFPLTPEVDPRSMVVAVALGLLFTLLTTALAAWAVSRMTVAAALRDLPEPPAPRPPLAALLRGALAALPWRGASPLTLARAWSAVGRELLPSGIVPLLLGVALARAALRLEDGLLAALSQTLLLAGLVLLMRSLALAGIRWHAVRRGTESAHALARAVPLLDRGAALLLGGGIALYWALPLDALGGLGGWRAVGDLRVASLAGLMMVAGAVLALAPNLDLALAPVRWVLSGGARLQHVARVALIYPARQRFRTGISLALFGLVCFTMVTLACIAASATRAYDNLPDQAAGYDIAGQPLFRPVGGVTSLTSELRGTSAGAAGAVAAVGAATPLPLGVLQPGAADARWGVYPASAIDGAFLHGVGLPLVARASGYGSDAAVWQAVRERPGNVVIDVGALSRAEVALLGSHQPPAVAAGQFLGPPIAAGLPGVASLAADRGATGPGQEIPPLLGALASDPRALRTATLELRGVATGKGTIAPTPLWVSDLRGGPATRVTVVGIVANSIGARYGLLGSPATFAAAEQGLAPFGNEYYFFKLASGADPQSEAASIGSALLPYGFETTVLQDALLAVNGPNVFISRVLVGLVGLTLLVGMAALAVTGSRAVVERRQQIGMLRALGFRRRHVQLIFLLESAVTGAAGVLVGLVLGLLLSRNLFAVNFFSPVRSGLYLVVPWGELAVICGAAVAAALLAALLPAWQAGKIAPADALRYE